MGTSPTAIRMAYAEPPCRGFLFGFPQKIMASFNKVVLMGNLTRDPELRQTQGGSYIAKAGIALNERVPDGQGGYRDDAHFFDLTIFGKQAESFAKWFKKGRPVLVEGRLNYGSWEDKSTGQKRSKVDVVVQRWHFVGGQGEQGGGQGGGYSQASAPATAPDFPQADDFGGNAPAGNAPAPSAFPDDVPF